MYSSKAGMATLYPPLWRLLPLRIQSGTGHRSRGAGGGVTFGTLMVHMLLSLIQAAPNSSRLGGDRAEVKSQN